MWIQFEGNVLKSHLGLAIQENLIEIPSEVFEMQHAGRCFFIVFI